MGKNGVSLKAQQLATLVRRHRRVHKALTGYILPYRKAAVSASYLLMQPHDTLQLGEGSVGMRICACWNQCRTGTGRLSCSIVNLQALPRNNATNASPPIALAASAAASSQQPDQDVLRFVDRYHTLGDADEGEKAAVELEEPQQEACVSAFFNMRSIIHPTPAAVLAATFLQQRARWNESTQRVEIDPQALEQLDRALPVTSNPSPIDDSASVMFARCMSHFHVEQTILDALGSKLAGEERILLAADYNQVNGATQCACIVVGMLRC